MRFGLDSYTDEEIQVFVDGVTKAEGPIKQYYLSRFVLYNLEKEKFRHYCCNILKDNRN
jgi:hypothetical protein